MRRYQPTDFEDYLIDPEGFYFSLANASDPALVVSQSAFQPGNAEAVLAGCAFLRHCCDDARTLPEPEWRAMLSVVGRCQDGERLAHEFSRPYDGYSEEATKKKLQETLQAGPYTCGYIIDNLDGGGYCQGCPARARGIRSPVVLGSPTPSLPRLRRHPASMSRPARCERS